MGHRSGFFDQISGKHAGRYLRAVAFRRNHRGAFEGRVEKMFNSDGPLPLRMLFS